MEPLSPTTAKRPVPDSPSDVTDSRPTKKQVVDGLPAASSLSGKATASEQAAMSGAQEPEEAGEENALSGAASAVAESSSAPAAAAALNKVANTEVKDATKDGKGRQYGRDQKPQKKNKDWNAQNRDTWMARSKEKGGASDEEGGEDGEGKKRLPKKKAAILIGYCGTGYSGMQIQIHESKTIEGDVFEALTKAGAVSAENATDHRKVDVHRAARTDAGVHAAGNVISMKLILAPPLPEGYDTLASYVNSFLPPQIRMWGFVRTMKSFQARTACDSRKYEYLLPSYCLLPPRSGDVLAKRLDESSPGWRDTLGPAAEFSDAGIAAMEAAAAEVEGAGAEMDDDLRVDKKMRGEFERKRGWRVDTQTLDRFKALIAKYKGTHNFHNYTLGKSFNERSVKRYMISLVVNDPVVVGEIEWISVQIHGQSFMLHQIRKMLSLAILACRTGTPPSLIPETFGPKRIHIPKAPPLGLLLEAPQFGQYNGRIRDKKGGLQVDRDPVDWDVYAKEMKDFKLSFIYDKLRQDELETHVFHKWIRQMDATETDILAFLNSKGVIPPEAEVGKLAQAERDAKREEDAAAEGKEGVEGGAKKKKIGEEMESDDEEVDQELLKRGELEG